MQAFSTADATPAQHTPHVCCQKQAHTTSRSPCREGCTAGHHGSPDAEGGWSQLALSLLSACSQRAHASNGSCTRPRLATRMCPDGVRDIALHAKAGKNMHTASCLALHWACTAARPPSQAIYHRPCTDAKPHAQQQKEAVRALSHLHKAASKHAPADSTQQHPSLTSRLTSLLTAPHFLGPPCNNICTLRVTTA